MSIDRTSPAWHEQPRRNHWRAGMGQPAATPNPPTSMTVTLSDAASKTDNATWQQ